MEADILKAIQTELKEKLTEMQGEITKNAITKEAFTEKMNEVNDKVKELGEGYDKLDQHIKDSLENFNQKLEEMNLTRKQAETFADEVVSQSIAVLKEYREKGSAAKKNLSVKSAPTAVSLGVSTTTGAGVILEDREAGINYAPKRAPLMLDLILSGTTTSDRVTWVEKTDEAGAPAFKKEFETFPKRSWKTILREALVKKIAVYSEYSKEILEDLDGFQAELRRDLVEQIQLTLDTNILRGEGGTSSDADHKGILEYAQNWSNGTFTVADPSIYDVIAVGVNQIREEHHNPTVVVMSPGTAMKMKLTKDKNGNYVIPPFAAANGVTVEGLPVVTNTLFDANEILIMDGSKAQFMWKRNWELNVTDSHSDNFIKDVFTVTLTGRGVLKVKATDAKAFVHVADVDDAITALTPAS